VVGIIAFVAGISLERIFQVSNDFRTAGISLERISKFRTIFERLEFHSNGFIYGSGVN